VAGDASPREKLHLLTGEEILSLVVVKLVNVLNVFEKLAFQFILANLRYSSPFSLHMDHATLFIDTPGLLINPGHHRIGFHHPLIVKFLCGTLEILTLQTIQIPLDRYILSH